MRMLNSLNIPLRKAPKKRHGRNARGAENTRSRYAGESGLGISENRAISGAYKHLQLRRETLPLGLQIFLNLLRYVGNLSFS